jgi:hypothetical protein
MSDYDYASGGTTGNTCLTCTYRYPDPHAYGWGWCTLRDYASVSATGGCAQHQYDDPAVRAGQLRALLAAAEAAMKETV